ncbi:hypothetical protein BD410DRAFT_784801 [Rickenella mellea]|uniref:CS domain-containing protein n=1 Tax=Rickenella mellea TaxID=50990 RepID=A0A4Y7QF01_9AGAM|nr:hypothetical protein BD410DRAFT_784801 [Rickenella mellea]
MDVNRQVYYSWHQSHDQATVLLLVPYETQPEDVHVVIEQNYLVAGVRGQQPIIKGRLYGNVDSSTSVWQLEPRPSARERTTSTTSTVSTRSSFAFVSDAEISSSFAASLDSGAASESEDIVAPSPAMSSPASANEDTAFFIGTGGTAIPSLPRTRPTSPRAIPSMVSSISSVDSLHSARSGRLLTLHLEKGESIIWPSLIVGPAPAAMSPLFPGPLGINAEVEVQYNMDPTSLGLIAEDLLDIRKNKEEAFECFVRAWHQAPTSLSTLRLVTHYVPLGTILAPTDGSTPPRGSPEYYFQCIGGPEGLARLYREAGLLHLEGAATMLMSSSYTALSSIRTVEPHPSYTESGTERWRRDREAARRYFDRASQLCPQLDVPSLPSDVDDVGRRRQDLQMPSMEIPYTSTPGSHNSPSPINKEEPDATLRPRRRRKDEGTTSMVQQAEAHDQEDNTWYLYIPGLIGAGTALLVVGVVSAISFSSWRKNQN